MGEESERVTRINDGKTAGHPSVVGSGDFHFYPTVPQTRESDQFVRSLGEGMKPIFLSETESEAATECHPRGEDV